MIRETLLVVVSLRDYAFRFTNLTAVCILTTSSILERIYNVHTGSCYQDWRKMTGFESQQIMPRQL